MEERKKASTTRPFLKEEMKIARCAWVEANRWLFTEPNIPVAFMDEKWFYTTTRLKKIKTLPKGSGEIKMVGYRYPQSVNWQFPVKVMYFGCVACPNAEGGLMGEYISDE